MKRVSPLLIAFLLLPSIYLNAQHAERSILSTTGSFFSSNTINMAFTIGDIMTETFNSENNILTQGFIQPEQSSVSKISSISNDVTLKIYPNPCKAQIHFKLSQIYDHDKIECFIYDLNGRLVFKDHIYQRISEKDISLLQPGCYVVKIKSENQKINLTTRLQKL